MALKFRDELVRDGIVNPSSAVRRGRQQVLSGVVEGNVEHFILVTRQSAEASTFKSIQPQLDITVVLWTPSFGKNNYGNVRYLINKCTVESKHQSG